MDLYLVLLGILVFVLSIIYFYGIATYDYWEKYGLPHIKPKYPFFGTSFDSVFSLKSSIEVQSFRYNFFKGEKYGGIFSFRKPSLFIKDPELIEKILKRDFAKFYNRGINVDTTLDPLEANLVNLRDAAWKALRNKLAPVFSLNKLREMFPQIIDCSNDFVKFISKFENEESFDARKVVSKFSINVIASCAFGLNVNFNDADTDFEKIGKLMYRPSCKSKLRMVMRSHCVWLLTILNWKQLPKEVEDYFVNTIKEVSAYRVKNNIVRHDFLDLLNELKENDRIELQNNFCETKTFIFDDKILAANAFVFYVAGFETTTSLISYTMFELGINQEVQEKLYQEIIEATDNLKNELNFDIIKSLNYLHCVLSESLRKYPPAPSIQREVTGDYKLPGSSVTLPKGTLVLIPVYSLHHDPCYFPDPEKFIPERFTDENKIVKGAYLPFGDGPRMCIGLRFALLEAKVIIAKIISNYKLIPTRKTQKTIQFTKQALLLIPNGGIHIGIKKR